MKIAQTRFSFLDVMPIIRNVRYWLIATAMLLCCLDANAEIVASGTCGQKLTWTLNDEGLLSIYGEGEMDNYSSSSQTPWYNNRHSILSLYAEPTVTSIGRYAFSECFTRSTSIVIPEGIVSIGDYAFYKSLSGKITIPDNVTTIGKYAFCKSELRSITIPGSVKKIGDSAFSGCWALYDLVILSGVSEIGDNAFKECTSLESVDIPKGVTRIGKETFYCCERITSINIPEGVTYIGDGAFCGCYELISINIPEGVTSIGQSCFASCWALSSVILPKSLEKIGLNSFFRCYALTTISIPTNVTNIGMYAFKQCTNLTSVICHAKNPPALNSTETFYGKYTSTTVYVPEESIELYKSANYWAIFNSYNNIKAIDYNIITYIVDDIVYQVDSLAYGEFVVTPKEPTKQGYTFSGWSEVPTTMPNYDVTITGTFIPNELAINDSEGIDFAPEHDAYVTSLYHRELASGKYGTIMLPFSPDAESLENFAFYSLTSAENDMLIFDEVEAPQANTPYLFSLREGKSATQITGGETTISSVITNPEEVNGWQMIGSFTNQTIATSEDADNYYYAYTSADNQLHKVTKTLNVKPYRAYFVTDTANPAQLAVRTRNGETTLIDAAEVEDFATGTYYDLSGRRVENPTKGLYIVNGKKVIL